jgi:hypothetical protein
MKGTVRFVAVCLALTGTACSTVQNAAAKDPMKCERDPSCSKARSSYADCTRQCVDDPECVRLCDEMQDHVDSMGR